MEVHSNISVTILRCLALAFVCVLCSCGGREQTASPATGTARDSLDFSSAPTASASRVDTLYVPASPTGRGQEYIPWNLPEWAATILRDGHHLDRYELFLDLNPYYVAGRFDEDSLVDLAVQVREKASGRRGIAILHRGSRHVAILGAGQSLGNGGDDWTWLWVWRVEDGLPEAEPAFRGHDVLLVEKPESAGGRLWWDGERYQWTQAGD